MHTCPSTLSQHGSISRATHRSCSVRATYLQAPRVTQVRESACGRASQLLTNASRSALASQVPTSGCVQQPDSLGKQCRTSGQSQRSQQLSNDCRRRQLLEAGAAAVLLSAAGGLQPQVAAATAAAAASCDLQTSASGLQWCDLKVGDGANPIKGAFTKAHYTGKLAASGAQFDSSYQKKQPLIFKLGEREVIEAWDVAILGAEDIPPMREGGKRLIVAPPGPLQKQGTKSLLWVVGLSEAIEDAGLEVSPEGAPTSALIFEIELLKKRGNRG